MTHAQFAWAILADEKWVENSARLIGLSLKYTTAEARWLGLVRDLNQRIGLPLAKAAALATNALAVPPHTEFVVLGSADDSSTAIAFYPARYYSTHIAALAAALELGGTRQRGRRAAADTSRRLNLARALKNAAQYGVDINFLREGLELSPSARLQIADEKAAYVNAIRAARRKG